MTTTTAALVLAWIAIVLLALATAGLLRRVEQLSSRGTVTAEPVIEPVRGLRLPLDQHLGELAGGSGELLVLFASTSCATCQTAVDGIVGADPADFRVAVAVREPTFGPLEVPSGWVHRTSAQALFQIMRIPATPYLVRLGPDGTIVDSAMVVGSFDIKHWLTQQPAVANAAGREGART
jgi:hypothetical protein